MPPSISDPAGDPAIEPVRRFVWPAEYYSSATPKGVLPPWASYGCGAAALAILLLVFLGGAWLSSGGFTQFMDFALGMSLGEMRGMYTSEVTAPQKDALERAVEDMRTGLRAEKTPINQIQPFMQTLQKSIKDDKVTPAEVKSLTEAARKANQPPPRH